MANGAESACVGINHSPAADVQRLRGLLEYRYHYGFPVLKELVQNADDAGASSIQLGWSHGLASADHPLLRSPAAFAVNDGRFKPSDARAICRLGVSNKGDDPTKVGRFGLGLKAVFHLSEAFFFGSNQVPGEGNYLKLLNPWLDPERGDPLHTDWDRVSQADQDAISDLCGAVAGSESKQWFCVWLPLRTRETSGKRKPICKYYPAETDMEDLFGAVHDYDYATLFPLLNRTASTESWLRAAVATHSSEPLLS